MNRLRVALTSSSDKWLDWGSDTLLGWAPLPWRSRLVFAASRLFSSVWADRIARAGAITRDERAAEHIVHRISRGTLTADQVFQAAIAQDESVLAHVRSRHLLIVMWLWHVQRLRPETPAAVTGAGDWLLRARPRTRWDAKHIAAHAESLLALGLPDEAADSVRRLSDDSIGRDMLLADAVHDTDVWRTVFTRVWADRGVPAPRIVPGTGHLFDRLSVDRPTRPGPEGPLVTVVISSFRPDERLALAVKSTLASTWTALEVLVVDDASGEEFSEIYAQVDALDDRVRVHHMATNGGTYAIRNWALRHAQGEFVTFHDSDDWMHSERIETQVTHLLSRRRLLHNASLSARVTDALRFSHDRNLGAQICEPSLMIRRERVHALIGDFDTVRKGADAEYRIRLERATRTPTIVVGAAPLTLQVVDAASLSSTDIVRHWFTEARRVYRSCFEHWHRGGQSLRLDSAGPRAWFAPASMRGDRAPLVVDVVVASPWLEWGTWNRTCKAAMTALQAVCGSGVSVAIANGTVLMPVARLRAALANAVAGMLNRGEVRMADPQLEVRTAVVLCDERLVDMAAKRWPEATIVVLQPGRRSSGKAAAAQALALLGRR